MSRPKSSVVGVGNLFLDIYNARQINRTNTGLNVISQQLEEQHSDLSARINNVAEMQFATAVGVATTAHGVAATLSIVTETLSGLTTIQTELEQLSRGQWDILNFMHELDRKEEILGDLRLFLMDVEEEVENIILISENYLEFALLMAEELKLIFESNNVSIEQFKRMPSIEDLKWAKKVIRSVDLLCDSLEGRL